ncbi:MAG: hypothetical protein K8F25_08045 [Fimbriimonadaceae bacterium]|nr:hypothetical protein [Alphaproteobacteria bacterium]
MKSEQGLRNRWDRIVDAWSRLDMWTRYGLSFVGAFAILFLIIEVFGWFL